MFGIEVLISLKHAMHPRILMYLVLNRSQKKKGLMSGLGLSNNKIEGEAFEKAKV